jgi:hypothetical protein
MTRPGPCAAGAATEAQEQAPEGHPGPADHGKPRPRTPRAGPVRPRLQLGVLEKETGGGTLVRKKIDP